MGSTGPGSGHQGTTRARPTSFGQWTGDCCPSVAAVDTTLPHGPDLQAFTRTVEQVQAYVRSEPGAYAGLVETAEMDPVGTMTSLVALGAVLLDIAAGAFSLTPDDMLAKVSAGIVGSDDIER